MGVTKLKKVCQDSASVLEPRNDLCRTPDGLECRQARDQMVEMHGKCFFLRLESQLEFANDCVYGPFWFYRHITEQMNILNNTGHNWISFEEGEKKKSKCIPLSPLSLSVLNCMVGISQFSRLRCLSVTDASVYKTCYEMVVNNKKEQDKKKCEWKDRAQEQGTRLAGGSALSSCHWPLFWRKHLNLCLLPCQCHCRFGPIALVFLQSRTSLSLPLSFPLQTWLVSTGPDLKELVHGSNINNNKYNTQF